MEVTTYPLHPETTAVPRRLLDEAEAAAYLGVSRALLRKQRMQGTLPGGIPAVPFIRIGKRGIRYDVSDLDRWIQANRVSR